MGVLVSTLWLQTLQKWKIEGKKKPMPNRYHSCRNKWRLMLYEYTKGGVWFNTRSQSYVLLHDDNMSDIDMGQKRKIEKSKVKIILRKI